MKPPEAIDAERPGEFLSSDAGGTWNWKEGVTPAILRGALLHSRSPRLSGETAGWGVNREPFMK